ncbi:MAG TPA: DUF5996 family protein [Burkholderiaceae bacterium]|nr:DUF5996 family protein [Burkholderiaceae bacterium]
MIHSSAQHDVPQSGDWPSLAFEAWRDTYATLHMWSQIVGKIRLVQAPWLNHSWQVTLYPTARGLTTSAMPYGSRTFQIDFDFIEHRLLIQVSDGSAKAIRLEPRSVADFYQELFAKLRELGLDVKIHGAPNEVVDAIPFDRDHIHASYDPDYANRFWRALLQATRVFNEFRGRFVGKCSPVHFFWGSFDLAVTRFSGRPAPTHPGGVPNCPDRIMREAYSHELASCGFWPGNEQVPYPAFYAYAYPVPKGFDAAQLHPENAFYDTALGEFILPYDDVRQAQSPDAMLLDFLQSSYDAAASLGDWDRSALECAVQIHDRSPADAA